MDLRPSCNISAKSASTLSNICSLLVCLIFFYTGYINTLNHQPSVKTSLLYKCNSYRGAFQFISWFSSQEYSSRIMYAWYICTTVHTKTRATIQFQLSGTNNETSKLQTCMLHLRRILQFQITTVWFLWHMSELRVIVTQYRRDVLMRSVTCLPGADSIIYRRSWFSWSITHWGVIRLYSLTYSPIYQRLLTINCNTQSDEHSLSLYLHLPFP